MYTSIYDTWRS